MDIQPWHMLATAVTSALGGGGVTKLLDVFVQKDRARSYAMGAVDHAVETAMKSTTAEIERLSKTVDEVRSQHASCERELAQGRRERDTMQRQIDALMSGRVAGPGEQPPVL